MCCHSGRGHLGATTATMEALRQLGNASGQPVPISLGTDVDWLVFGRLEAIGETSFVDAEDVNQLRVKITDVDPVVTRADVPTDGFTDYSDGR